MFWYEQAIQNMGEDVYSLKSHHTKTKTKTKDMQSKLTSRHFVCLPHLESPPRTRRGEQTPSKDPGLKDDLQPLYLCS